MCAVDEVSPTSLAPRHRLHGGGGRVRDGRDGHNRDGYHGGDPPKSMGSRLVLVDAYF